MASACVTNTLGMRMHRLDPGTFRMGARSVESTDWRIGRDETPRHEVTLSQPFAMAETPVTNEQFEAFEETHAARRGSRGLSTGDEEAALGVSWNDAVAFCDWLSEKTGEPYRLPTEAEWEYACRAGSSTAFHPGDTLPDSFYRHQVDDWHPEPVDLTVGDTLANDWGLRDLHGVVEEWCLGWHGPYPHEALSDPVGPRMGIAKVTRGGSHNTAVRHLRSASRAGALPGTRSWLIGFRPVIGPMPDGEWTDPPAFGTPVEIADREVAWQSPTRDGEPCFAGPDRFVPETAEACAAPVFEHNHCPAVTWCANGDLLAIWFSTENESDREMVILGSRFRRDTESWADPSVFFDVPDRNMTGSALYHHPGNGMIHHFNGVGAGSHWANLALVMRTSSDDGRTWSAPHFVDRKHDYRNQVIAGTIETANGDLIQPCDATSSGNGGTAIHRSPDDGDTWDDPGEGAPLPTFEAGGTGGWIAGIHAGVVELEDGRLLAFGRGDNIEGRMPQSISADGGRTWQYDSSPFPPISGGQRLVLQRLREGPLLFASFTDSSADSNHPGGMGLRTPAGRLTRASGLFVALSFDEGRSWPVRRLVSPGATSGSLDGGAWTAEFRADETTAEPMGYLAATQTPDGIFHLLSSALHYRFDLDWMTEYADHH